MHMGYQQNYDDNWQNMKEVGDVNVWKNEIKRVFSSRI